MNPDLSLEAKWLLASVFSVCTSLLSSLWPALASAGLAIGLCVFYRPELRTLRHILAVVLLFCSLLWLTLPLSAVLYQRPETVGLLPALLPGLRMALIITLKSCAITTAFFVLLGKAGASASGRALLNLGLPRKFVTLFLLTHANNALFLREFRCLWDAARLRGFEPRHSWHTWKVCAWLAGLLLVRAWHKARQREQAMKLRGFSGLFPLAGSKAQPCARPGARMVTPALCLASVLLLMLERVF